MKKRGRPKGSTKNPSFQLPYAVAVRISQIAQESGISPDIVHEDAVRIGLLAVRNAYANIVTLRKKNEDLWNGTIGKNGDKPIDETGVLMQSPATPTESEANFDILATTPPGYAGSNYVGIRSGPGPSDNADLELATEGGELNT